MVFWLLILDMLWEIIKENRPKQPLPRFPWWFTILDLGTAATAAGIIGSLLIARNQFARSTRPSLGFRGAADKDSTRIALQSRWTVNLINGGPGPCVILRCEWRYTIAGERSQDAWTPWEELVAGLARDGLVYGRHYHALHLTAGGVLPVGADPSLVEIAAFSERALSQLQDVEVRIQVVDLVGDVHERSNSMMHSAHAITGIPRNPSP
jgi:hypothetical protein